MDGLRGVAAIGVAWFHLYMGGGDTLTGVDFLGAGFVTISAWGRFGVQLFFVISGYVLSLSLIGQPDAAGRIRAPRDVGLYMIRRMIRLDPMLWLSIFAAIAATGLLRSFGDSAAEWPTVRTVFANMFYLQPVFDTPLISAVYWTLVLEAQWYLLAAVSALCCHALSRRGVRNVGMKWFAAMTLASHLWTWQVLPYRDGVLTPHLYLFLLGVLGHLYRAGHRFAGPVLGLHLLAVLAAGLLHGNSYNIAGAAAAAAISGIPAVRPAVRFLSSRPVLYFGRLSYGIYLLHLIIGGTMIDVAKNYTTTAAAPAARLGWVVGALAVTIAIADLAYRLVERPSIRLSKKIPVGRRITAAAVSGWSQVRACPPAAGRSEGGVEPVSENMSSPTSDGEGERRPDVVAP